MNNTIRDAITLALQKEFGNDEELEMSGFIVLCLKSAQNLFRGNRFSRSNQFCIQYVPNEMEDYGKSYDIGERMFWCLERVSLNGESIRGTSMNYQVTDGVLHFMVDYNYFVDRVTEDASDMENFSVEELVKGESKA